MNPSTSKRIVRRGRVFPEIQWTEERKAQEKGINLDYDQAELESDRQTHEQLRQEGKLKSL